MDELWETFEIGRSLSMKGCPHDNAVAEATYKIMKTEFVNQMNFQSLSSARTIQLRQLVQQASHSWNIRIYDTCSVPPYSS